MKDPLSRIEHLKEHQHTKASQGSPGSPDMKSPSTPSVKRSKRGIQKRVISVPIKEVEGSLKSKSDNAAPPSDSWAWRKYGQKPIKGSPYPRGYYRCSSYKGCPARKQVERSKADPSMLMITYSFEHNHTWPLPMRNLHQSSPKLSSPDKKRLEPAPLEKSLRSATAGDDEFCWFDGMETVHSSVIQSSLFTNSAGGDVAAELSVIFPLREEEDSLFADLGELPECSAVFGNHPGADAQMQIC